MSRPPLSNGRRSLGASPASVARCPSDESEQRRDESGDAVPTVARVAVLLWDHHAVSVRRRIADVRGVRAATVERETVYIGFVWR